MDSLKPEHVSDVRMVLKHNGFLIDDDVAYKAHQNVASLVDDILGRGRGSTMKPEVQKALAQTLKGLGTAHKATFHVNFMTKVLAAGMQVQVSENAELPMQEQMAWITREWAAKNLRIGWLAPLRWLV